MTLRQIPGGGTSSNPTAFGSFSSMKLKVGWAQISGGNHGSGFPPPGSHAYVRFVMGT